NNILIHLLDESQFPLLFEIKKIITSFASRIDVVDMNNIPLKKTIDMIKAPSSTQKKIVNFILNADLFLDDFKYLTDEEMGLEMEGFTDEEQNFQEKNSSSFVEMLHLSSVYKGVAVPSVLFDSKGTKKIAALASYVIDSLENGRILIVDELDNSLHFRLTRAIISLFNNELNHNAQLICTVHVV
ncbi:MAG: ATP-binding protein, partial [Clostridia bacterium]|nr:ATP-binding protein [Clostridia bacterium]